MQFSRLLPLAHISRRTIGTSKPLAKILSNASISPRVVKAEYAVRGELVIRAENIAKQLAKDKQTGQKTLPFEEIIFCNIGNPQSLGQQPLTFFRQLLALVEYPPLMLSPKVGDLFPADVIARAKKIVSGTPGGVGAYSHSKGLPFVRQSIAQFIEKRDGFKADPEHIFVHNGASPAVQDTLRLLIRDSNDGIMIPTPQYPLYSASVALLGGRQVGYYLNEEKQWGLSLQELQRSLNEATQAGTNVRALAVINPGNPTGQVLSKENMIEVVQFCKQNNLVLMADEVYQENVYIKEQ